MLHIVNSNEGNHLTVTPSLYVDHRGPDPLFDMRYLESVAGMGTTHFRGIQPDGSKIVLDMLDASQLSARITTETRWPKRFLGLSIGRPEVTYRSSLNTSIEGFALTGICAHLYTMRRQNNIVDPSLKITPDLVIKLPENPDAPVVEEIVEATTYPGIMKRFPGLVVSSIEPGTTNLISSHYDQLELPEVASNQQNALSHMLGNEALAVGAIRDIYGATPEQIAQLWDQLRKEPSRAL